MHGFAKRGLALIAAASGLIMGSAVAAAADASVSGQSTFSGGVLSGNEVGVPVDVPVNFCGNQAVLAAVRDTDRESLCEIGAGGASVDGSTYGSGGILSGNEVGVPVDVPVNVCGNQIGVLSVLDRVGGTACAIN
jgi:hypothetical protein